MPLDRPSITAIRDRVRADFDAHTTGLDPRLRRSLSALIVHALSGAAHGLYGFAERVVLDLFPDTATAEALERWASIWGVTRQGASFATGQATATGTNGAVIAASTRLVAGDGTVFETTAAAIVGGGIATLALEAIAAGAAGNLETGSLLTFESPIADVDSTVTVAAPGLSGGADAQSDSSLRAALLARIASPPQGGNLEDWQRWCFEVAGVTRAWVFPPGAESALVSVFFVRDGESPITPDSGEVATMQAHLEARRPLGSRVQTSAPTLVPTAVTITGLLPDTPEIRAAIVAELEDLHLREASPGGTLFLSHIREAISLAAGEANHVLTVPAADVVRAAGELAVLGTVTFA